jgi:hypothetical protein
MENQNTSQMPSLVKDPAGTEFVDINPLFQMVNDRYDRDFNYLAETIDDAIQYISYTISEEMSKSDILAYHNAISNLYNVRNVFRAMTNFKK